MRHIPCTNGVPVAWWMEAHTVYSQHYGQGLVQSGSFKAYFKGVLILALIPA